ncbi:hypothetical protein [Nocardia vinacea]|uniref:hypothetical protein n=1 Tax=Nocardia vinacea TaxID=96468 RepID=UPI000593F37E|nr:hypothetical protein [Nocardia vinacea]
MPDFFPDIDSEKSPALGVLQPEQRTEGYHAMPAATTALIITIAAICLLAVVVWRVAVPDAYPDGAIPVADILDRVAEERALRTDSWELEPPHRAPSELYTPEQAHTEMRRHCECGTDLCTVKDEAFWTLVDAEYAVPDARAVR